MKIYAILFSALLGSVLSSCIVYTSTYSNYDQSVDFRKYKTFAWLPDSAMEVKKDSLTISTYDDDIIRNNAKNFIIQNLGSRGYSIQTDSPDILVELILLNQKMERVISIPHYHVAPYYYYNRSYYPYYYPNYRHFTYYGWGWRPQVWEHNRTYKETYVKGTIIINMYDRKLKKQVWTGSAEGDIYDPYYAKTDIHPAIERIMRKFPVKPI